MRVLTSMRRESAKEEREHAHEQWDRSGITRVRGTVANKMRNPSILFYCPLHHYLQHLLHWFDINSPLNLPVNKTSIPGKVGMIMQTLAKEAGNGPLTLLQTCFLHLIPCLNLWPNNYTRWGQGIRTQRSIIHVKEHLVVALENKAK